MPSTTSLAGVVFALLASSSFVSAAPTKTVRSASRVPYNAQKPGATPAFVAPAQPSNLMTHDEVLAHLETQPTVRARKIRSLDDVVEPRGYFGGAMGDTSFFESKEKKEKRMQHMIRDTAASTCLDSSNNDTVINSLFYLGGANTVVQLCAGANINLGYAIFFTAANQELSTVGYPTDDTRGTLTLATNSVACAIYGPCDNCQNAALRNIQIDGGRETYGYNASNNNLALIEMGGNTRGQTIDSIKAWETQGWSILHGIEGYENSCSGMIITNNEIGPSGNSPTNGNEYRKRALWNERRTYADDAQASGIAPGEWADGISLACKASTVKGNTIIDATDGAIVTFGAPGSVISGNTIYARERVLLGGLNAVDYGPFEGDFTGTVIEDNTVVADTTMIKIGMALGSMSWGSDNRTAARTYGGTYQNNVFKSGSTGYFGYASSVAGHENATIIGNDASGANFGGESTQWCIDSVPVPDAQAFVWDHETAPGSVLQNNFLDYQLVFLICRGPGSVTSSGVSIPLNSTEIGSGVSTTSAAPSSTSTVASSSSTSTVASTTVASSSSTSSVAPTTTVSTTSSVVPTTTTTTTVVPTTTTTTTVALKTTTTTSSTTVKPSTTSTTTTTVKPSTTSVSTTVKSTTTTTTTTVKPTTTSKTTTTTTTVKPTTTTKTTTTTTQKKTTTTTTTTTHAAATRRVGFQMPNAGAVRGAAARVAAVESAAAALRSRLGLRE